jgi:hypothetical protein
MQHLNSFTIVLGLSAPSAGHELMSGLTIASNIRAGFYLTITLQAQPLPAAPVSMGTPLAAGVNSNGTSASTFNLLPAYSAISTPATTAETRMSTPASHPSDTAPVGMTTSESGPPLAPTSPESQADVTTALFAGLSQGASLEIDTAGSGSNNAAAGETVAKLAIVLAGLWGSVSMKEPQRTRRPVCRIP